MPRGTINWLGSSSRAVFPVLTFEKCAIGARMPCGTLYLPRCSSLGVVADFVRGESAGERLLAAVLSNSIVECSRFALAATIATKLGLKSSFSTVPTLTCAGRLSIFARRAADTRLWTNLPFLALERAELAFCTSAATLSGLVRPLRAEIAASTAFIRLIFSSSAIDGFKNCRWATMPYRTNNAGLTFMQLVPPVIAPITG